MVKSKEFFVLKDGVACDADLHEPILAGGDKKAALALGIAQAKKAGLTVAEIAVLYATQDDPS